ncbi:MAG: T9SS type A sorting domain-containing protein [Ignavibacteriae bacterium]|nr:T9SS type A sorting domain-containing protein [Ignavibacteriota bacterium]
MKCLLLFSVIVFFSQLFPVDALAQWIQIPGTDGKYLYAISGDGQTMFAGGIDSLYRSTNYGMSWQSIETDLPNDATVISLMNSGENVVAGTDFWGVYRSLDNGVTWDSTTLEYFTVYSLGRNGSTYFAAADLFECLDDCGIFRSTDNGFTWDNIFFNADPLTFSVSSSGLLLSDYEDLYRSTNNGNLWTRLNALPNQGYIYATRVFGNTIFVATDSGLYRETLPDTTWQLSSSGLPANAQVVNFAESGSTLFANIDGASVYVSEDSGASWQSLNDGLPNGISVQLVHAQNGFLYATTSDGIWVRAVDDGKAALLYTIQAGWNMVSLPGVPLTKVKTLLYPDANSPAFYYQAGYVMSDSLWNRYGYWVKFPFADTLLVLGDMVNSDSIPVLSAWNLIGSISDTVSVASIGSVPPGLVTSSFFGYSNGYEIADSIKPAKAYWVKANQNGTLFLNSTTTSSNKISIVPTDEPPPAPPEISSTNSPLPTHNSLLQNYPNPFNPTTNFGFRIVNFGLVTLKVFDVLGREVATLVNGNLHSGIYNVSWDASGQPSGVYYYKLQTEKFTETKKLLLAR